MSKIGEITYTDPLNTAGILYVNVVKINPNEKDDFCILTLKEEVAYTPTIRSLCLPNKPEDFYDYSPFLKATIFGFGWDDRIHDLTIGYAQQELRGTPVGSVERDHRERFEQEVDVKSRFKCQDDVNVELKMYNFLIITNDLNLLIYLYFRGKHLCTDPKGRTQHYIIPALVPGPLDQGSPLIMQENGRSAIIAMFLKTLPEVGLAAQLSPETVNWIYENADWTQESTESNRCTTFTSCSCGTATVQKRRKRSAQSSNTRFEKFLNKTFSFSGQSRTKPSHRMYHGTMVYAHDQLPWQVLIFNLLRPVPLGFDNHRDWLNRPPDGTNFDLCSGSLITNRLIKSGDNCNNQFGF